MSHLPPQKLPVPDPSSQSKTLFMAVPGNAAILDTRKGETMRRRSLAFTDPHAALDWCLARSAGFVLTFGRAPDPSLN